MIVQNIWKVIVRVCVCVCVFVRARVCLSVCVCVCVLSFDPLSYILSSKLTIISLEIRKLQ